MNIDILIEIFCKVENIRIEELLKHSRVRDVVERRQIFCYLVLEKNLIDKITTTKLGKSLNIDHATVLHSVKAVKCQVEIDKEFNKKVRNIEAKINSIIFDIKNIIDLISDVQTQLDNLKFKVLATLK